MNKQAVRILISMVFLGFLGVSVFSACNREVEDPEGDELEVSEVTSIPVTLSPTSSLVPDDDCRVIADEVEPAGLSPDEPYFVPGQVLVIGRSSDIQILIDANAIDLGLVSTEPTVTIELDFLNPDSVDDESQACISPFHSSTLDELEIHLYETLSDTVSTAALITTLGLETNPDTDDPLEVFADLNYRTGQIEGSPWSVGSAPWSVGSASPIDPAVTMVAPEDIAIFRQQWAFDDDSGGLGDLYAPDNARIFEDVGSPANIVLFDTAPRFEENRCASSRLGAPLFSLGTSYVDPVNDQFSVDEEHPDVSGHGPYAAGLAYGVAPHSNLHLYRVLDDTGRGDIAWLMKGLEMFMRGIAVPEDQLEGEALQSYILNMSLGADPNEELEVDNVPGGDPNDPNLESLETLLQGAYCHGATIVAAAGNASDENATPLPAYSPAEMDFVMGTAANDISGAFGCFSNAGDLAAPGGQGAPDPNDAARQCAPQLEACANGDSSFCMVSLYVSQSAPPQLAYWVGSSFSTPIVSGLSALHFQLGSDRDDVYDGIESGLMQIITPDGPPIVQLP